MSDVRVVSVAKVCVVEVCAFVFDQRKWVFGFQTLASREVCKACVVGACAFVFDQRKWVFGI